MRIRYRKFWNWNLSKTAWLIIAGVTLLISLVFIVVPLLGNSHIEDQNGPHNYALCQLTLEDLLSEHHSSNSFMSSRIQSGSATEVSGNLRNCDHTKCSFRAKKFSGIQAIHATKTDRDQLTLNIYSQVDAGNLEIVILVDDAYYAHVPVNTAQTITLEDVAQKLVVVKIAGESAAMEITVERMLP